MGVQAVLLGLCVLAAAEAGVAPFIKPCRQADGACMTASAQGAVAVFAAGVPALGLQPLDPMTVPRVQASQAGLDMDFTNTVVRGLRNCLVINVQRKTNKVFFDVKCSATLIGDYKLGGRLLILPIEGNGKYKIKIRDIVVKIVFDVAEKVVNGAKFWEVVGWQHTADVQTGVEFHFQNLFNGNKQLSDTIHQFANTNWKDIFREVAPPIVKAIVTRIVDETKKFFSKVPLTDLTLE